MTTALPLKKLLKPLVILHVFRAGKDMSGAYGENHRPFPQMRWVSTPEFSKTFHSKTLAIGGKVMLFYCALFFSFPLFSIKEEKLVCQITSIVAFSTFTSSPRQIKLDLVSGAFVFKA